MIKKDSYTLEHIKKIKGNRKIDTTILERNIYALGLLEALVTVGMPLIFKGGTCLTILLDSPKRLSTDIDVIVAPGTNVDYYIEKASKIFPFKSYKEQTRYGRNNIEKRHYKFVYDSPAFEREFYILLDILFEENHYTKLVEMPIKNHLINTEEPYVTVTMPSIDCIMGDKLTAFAPHTTGIPYGIDKELEIIKQMYDVACLFDVATDYDDVYNSYMNTVKTEILYRNNNCTYIDTLLDTIEASACVASRGQIGEDYPLLLAGIKKINNHIFDETFSAELAIEKACKVMYLATCILTNEKMMKIVDYDIYHDANISKSKYKKLSKIRNYEPLGFAYVVESIKLLDKYYDDNDWLH